MDKAPQEVKDPTGFPFPPGSPGGPPAPPVPCTPEPPTPPAPWFTPDADDL
jgi:hypothetical protein